MHARLAETVNHLDFYHALTWPQLSYVAEDEKGRIVGYILGKMLVPVLSQFSTLCSALPDTDSLL